MAKPQTEDRQFISAHAAAAVIGITAPTVYNWVRRGVLTRVYRDQVTGQLLLDRDEVQSLAPRHRIRRQQPES